SDTVEITFIDRDGDKTSINARVGSTILQAAIDNNYDLEGACGGILACTTCHVIFDPSWAPKNKLPPPTEDELDMLDLAFGLTETFNSKLLSRLGCQIIVEKKFNGLTLKLPSFDEVDAEKQ
ncbi:LOW QUALITY PROTEIN: hypothetical protein MXB_1671, partial [Myxobolus squamalis]